MVGDSADDVVPPMMRKAIPSELSGVEVTLLRLHGAATDRDFRREALFQVLRDKYLPPPRAKCLDLGCGTGWMALQLARCGHDVTALDPSAPLVAAARTRIAAAGYAADVTVGDAREARALGPFDVILCLDVLEHIADDVAVLAAIHDALLPGGVLIVTVPAIRALYGRRDRSLGHYRRYGKGDLARKVAAQGFQIWAHRYWKFVGVPPYWYCERIVGREIYDGLRSGRDSRAGRAIRAALTRWLRVEAALPLPAGLSLICIARRPPTTGRPARTTVRP